MLDITGRYADGWWPAGAWTPEDYAAKLKVMRDAGRTRRARPDGASLPAFIQICLIGDDDEIDEMPAGAAGQVDHPDADRRRT